MSAIVGKGILSAGGGGELNIAYGLTPPTDTSKLWVRMQGKPDTVESTDDVAVQVGEFVEYFSQDDLSPLAGHVIFNVPSGRICNGKMYTAINENFSIFNVTDLETKITSLNSVHTFLGKETGYADEVDAYLYNTTEQKWISLDGTPYTA